MTERAITSAAATAVEDAEEAEQLGLFGEPQTPAGQAHPRNHRRGPGRPQGARNKRTARSIAYLMARHRDPREVLLEMAEANVFDLAALLGCKPFEALQEKRLAAIGVLPYVAARITPEVLNDNRQVVYLTINEGAAQVAGEPGAGAVAVVLERVEYAEIDAAADGPSAATEANPGD